jgi:hypothetical protein
MAEWHLCDLRAALEKGGWTIVEHPGDDYRVAGTWELRRHGDDRAVHIDFSGLDDMQTLSIHDSYGCAMRDNLSTLYFRRARSRSLWETELAAFVASLDA